MQTDTWLTPRLGSKGPRTRLKRAEAVRRQSEGARF